MPKVAYHLDQNEIAQAVNYWIECGSPKPNYNGFVLFHYDPPSDHPTDRGNGVTASVERGDEKSWTS